MVYCISNVLTRPHTKKCEIYNTQKMFSCSINQKNVYTRIQHLYIRCNRRYTGYIQKKN